MSVETKSVMHVQSCCFANINLPFFLAVLFKLFIDVIQNFCYHGNVTSYFSQLARATRISEFGSDLKITLERHLRNRAHRQDLSHSFTTLP